MTKYLTPEGLEKLKKEFDYLCGAKRREVAEKLKHSVGFGDLSENAAYDEAKESQGFLEARISKLREIISQAKIIEKKENQGKIDIGCKVFLSSDGQNQEFQIVGPEEADILKGRISFQSPLGKLLLGRKQGETITLETLAGKTKYKILKIE